tara:strand:- start:15723 stop:16004 length:282 start_codon:yes stop_codon:yes gene_type:complete
VCAGRPRPGLGLGLLDARSLAATASCCGAAVATGSEPGLALSLTRELGSSRESRREVTTGGGWVERLSPPTGPVPGTGDAMFVLPAPAESLIC